MYMRIYEVAKELGISSKDILLFLKKSKIEASSHMSVLSTESVELIHKNFSPKSSPKASPIKSQKQEEVIVKKHEPKPVPKPAPALHHAPSVPFDVVQEPPVVPNIIPKKSDYVAEPIVFGKEELDFQGRIIGHEKINKLLGIRIGEVRRRRRGRKRRQKQFVVAEPKVVTEIIIEHGMLLCEAAELMGKPAGEIILFLLKKGLVCNRNFVLTVDQIRDVANHFGIKNSVRIGSAEPVSFGMQANSTQSKAAVMRWPIVVVMGHVDHGKTTLLDYIRKMNVAATEKGGITQHLGAYEVDCAHGKIVFLDTPGHEAFSYIRERGSRITDMAVLVIAADDGIKPQTIEAINHAKAASVPIIVAVNKIDKASPSSIETVKRQLAQHELMPEDWGGTTIVVPVSAKTGKGVQELLEMIILQSQMMDLKADASAAAKAFILESKIEKGLGPIATVICSEGTLRQGDYFVCGSSTGKIRLLINSNGKRINQSGPSVPVQVVGFDDFASIGDWLRVVAQSDYLKAKASRALVAGDADGPIHRNESITIGSDKRVLNLIIKTDTRGSKEAIMGCIDKLAKLSKEVKYPLSLVSVGIGDITESDVDLAANTGSMIIGFNVRTEKNALNLVKQQDVIVKSYNIIYHMVEELEALLEGKRIVEKVWAKVGEAVVKKIFDIKGVGIIAGCYLRDGILTRDCRVTCMRDGRKMGEGKVTSLQRDKKTVKEIHAGYECGFVCDGFNDWAEDDTVLCFAEVKEKQS